MNIYILNISFLKKKKKKEYESKKKNMNQIKKKNTNQILMKKCL